MTPRSLDRYRHKRNPARTPEPFAVVGTSAASAGRQRFVIQQHAARRMHWDFRLEIDGVLVSWAVPRGPAVDPKEKRLAVHTEDHPLEYGAFEGIIPAGNYGAGAVIVWDRGTYESIDAADPSDALARGKLDIVLSGHKLQGRWALVRTKRSEGKDWLLFKKADTLSSTPEPVVSQPESILSGLTVEELKSGVSRTAELAESAAAAAATRWSHRHTPLTPMLADTAEQPFSRHGWIFELKYDGIRALLHREPSGMIRLFSRNRRDISASFPEIVAAARHLPCERFLLDGEIIALHGTGAGSFERLQQRLGLTNRAAVSRSELEVPILMYCFDLLAVAGFDVRSLPLGTRKQLLQRFVPRRGLLRFADHVEDDGTALFDAARDHAVEGIVAKRAASPYQCGRRTRDWLKIKSPRTADLAIVGFVPGKGSRRSLGALMLAWRLDGEFAYAGNVGSGLDTRTIAKLVPQLRAASLSTPQFRRPPQPLSRSAVFVEPRLVAEVRYTEVTERGMLRQPVFLRLRDDKEVSDGDTLTDARPKTAVEIQVAPDQPQSNDASPRLQLTNLKKVFWPVDGYTKGDLLAYYRRVWPALARYLRDRPVVLTRYPDGINGKSFFQKNAPEFIPDWVPTCRIEDTEYFVCNDLDALLYVINLGCIPLHIWSARRDRIDRPDWAILDLDPKGAPFAHVVSVARHIHALLTPLQAPHFIKTSGQAGLHVLIPLDGVLTHHEARTFAEVLARVAATERSDIATVARPLGERGAKVYIDFLQNGFGKTLVAPFSVRPRPGATVSTPIDWGEVNARLHPQRFTMRTVPQRLRKRPDSLRPIFGAAVDVPAVLAALHKRLE